MPEREKALAAGLDAATKPKASRAGNADAGRLVRSPPYAGPVSARHQVDEQGRYDGRTLQELWLSVLEEVVRAVDPAEMAECHDDAPPTCRALTAISL